MHDQATDISHGGTPRHEPTDIETRPLRIAAVIFALVLVLIPAALLLLFKQYEKTATRPDRELVNSLVRPTAPTAPEPRLQAVPTLPPNVPPADTAPL